MNKVVLYVAGVNGFERKYPDQVILVRYIIRSIISSHFTEIWYGAGLVVGSFAGWTVAYGRLQWMEKHLDVHIFCNGHLLKKKKGDCPSPKVFDRYE